MSVSAVSFVPRGPTHGSASARGSRGQQQGGGASGRARRAGGAGGGGGGGGGQALRQGEPLPGLGTCKHYRHSYRWLRFPCCGEGGRDGWGVCRKACRTGDGRHVPCRC